MPERRRRNAILAAALVAYAAVFAPLPCDAQAGLVHLEDATLAPRGLLRVRFGTAWTRYDAVFSDTGTRPIGAFLTADSLGAAQLPALANVQSLVQSASGQTFALTLGHSRLGATAREEIIPITFEYGVTRRFALSVTTPIVRRRVAAVLQLDSAGFGANVGPNPQRTSSAAEQTNTQVQAEFANAAAQLQARLQSCQANPGGAGCAALLARQAEAQLLIQSSQAFAVTLADLYGSSTSQGAPFVPLAQGGAQQAISTRIGDFNTRYRDLLATTVNLIQARPRGAGGPAGPAELEDYVVGELARDSIATQERVRFGDVEVGVKALVLDHRADSLSKTAWQLAVASSVRLPTGSRQSENQIVNLASGGGSVVVDSRALFDARLRRFGLFAAMSYATSVRDVDTTNAASRNSRWTDIQLAPRWHVSPPLAFFAAYALRSTDKLGGDQLIGGGVSYSTVQLARKDRALPIEMRFTHLEAVAGDATRPKFFRDQVELRIYFRLH